HGSLALAAVHLGHRSDIPLHTFTAGSVHDGAGKRTAQQAALTIKVRRGEGPTHIRVAVQKNIVKAFNERAVGVTPTVALMQVAVGIRGSWLLPAQELG